MNRIVLIGNGFDLAHGLKTSYQDFINWYWEQRMLGLKDVHSDVSDDGLCSYKISWNNNITFHSYIFERGLSTETDWKRIKVQIEQDNYLITRKCTVFWTNICNSIATKNWVDIENEYYALLKHCVLKSDPIVPVEGLNNQFAKIQELLVEYLKEQNEENNFYERITELIYSPILERDVAISNLLDFNAFVYEWCKANANVWEMRIAAYKTKRNQRQIANILNSIHNHLGIKSYTIMDDAIQKSLVKTALSSRYSLQELSLPNRILFVSFNYTTLAERYCYDEDIFDFVHIHGDIEHPDSIIFGYGDELDEKYKDIQNKNEKEYLRFIKSFRYSESDNYRKVLQFADSDTFQIYIMGHSCGNSDRTLLNTLFEHKHCVSIKPFYHIDKEGKDNYMEIVQNIARNFTDMKLMRDRVVNKTYTKAFSDDRAQK